MTCGEGKRTRVVARACLFVATLYLLIAAGVIITEDVRAAAVECDNCSAQVYGSPYRAFEHTAQLPVYAAELAYTGPPKIVKCTIYEFATVCDGAKLEAVK